MAQDWDEEFEKLLVQVHEQRGPEARAELSVFGRLDQQKSPEAAARIKQKQVENSRKALRGPGGKKKPRDQHSDLEIGRYAEKHGIEAAMMKYPQICSEKTMSEYRRRARRYDEKSK
jgi:hypothetical protein